MQLPAKLALIFALLLLPQSGGAQIIITNTEHLSDQRLRLWFHVENMSSTNYSLEWRPGLADSSSWTLLEEATLTGIGGTDYQFEVHSATNQAGFYRVLSARELRARFDQAQIKVDEGTGIIELQILFDGHFRGALTYTVEGTGISSIDGLPGTISVDGTNATITIKLKDNNTIDQLRYVVFYLQGTSGLVVGNPGSATVNLEENDAIWHGILKTDTGSLAFQLKLLNNSATLTGELGSGGFGFFPADAIPAELYLSEKRFAASVNNIAVPADATLLRTPMTLALSLSAQDAQMGERVEPSLIEGSGTLAINIPAMPYLNATNQGRFVLQKPPIAPSTNEVELVNVP